MKSYLYPALLLAGCAGTPVHYDVANVRGPYGSPGTHETHRGGSCDAKLRIRVIDAQHAPVAGARVVVYRQVRAQAIEENLGTDEYRTHPVLTDARGFAHVCSPDDLPPQSRWEGIGGGFTIRGTAQLDVFDDRGRTATTSEPFAAQIVLR
ncbi:MAG: hypothetical protein HOV81_45175 [Kofleriaceae bacterium]|nr:hypothetical protein [Kofleriaceae bacterium]